MDPVTTVLLQALPAVGNAVAGEMAKKAAADLWDGVKSVLKRRFGADAGPLQVVEELQASPAGSPARHDAAARLAALKLGEDPEILGIVQHLAAALAEARTADRTQISATTIYSAVGQNPGTVTNHFNIGKG